MIEVFFGTNRDPRGGEPPEGFGSALNGDGGVLRFGRAEVADDLESVATVATEPEQLYPGQGRVRLGSNAVFAEIGRRMRRGTDTVLFIHGFDYDFGEALVDAARLKRLYPAGRRGRTFCVFTWPSDGTVYPVISYPRDRRYAEASGPALARAMLKLRDHVVRLNARLGAGVRSDLERDGALAAERAALCPGRLHLMAHSMGAYALRAAVQGMRREVGCALPRLFDEIVVIAGDEDADAFEHAHKLAPLPGLCRRVTVYYNREDVPLAVSDLTKGNPDRLGADGPAHPRSLPGKVSLVDCTEIVTEGFQEHRYHKTDEAAIRDIRAVLDGTASADIPHRRYMPETNSYRLVPEER